MTSCQTVTTGLGAEASEGHARLPRWLEIEPKNHEIPLSIGGGIRQSRTLTLLLRKAHSRRSERDGMAEGAAGDVREEEYSLAELRRLAGVILSEGEGAHGRNPEQGRRDESKHRRLVTSN